MLGGYLKLRPGSQFPVAFSTHTLRARVCKGFGFKLMLLAVEMDLKKGHE